MTNFSRSRLSFPKFTSTWTGDKALEPVVFDPGIDPDRPTSVSLQTPVTDRRRLGAGTRRVQIHPNVIPDGAWESVRTKELINSLL